MKIRSTRRMTNNGRQHKAAEYVHTAFTSKVSLAAFTNKRPSLSGDLADPCWRHAQEFDDFLDYRDQARSAGCQTKARLLYDKENLYLGVFCEEAGLKKPAVQPDEKVPGPDRWPPGCSLEIFVAPHPDSADYYQFATGPFGGRYDGFKKDGSWTGKWKAKTSMRPDGWTLEVAIPFSSIGAQPPKAGDAWGINICRSGTGVSVWVPIGLDFHRPDRFGTVIFGAYGDWWRRGFKNGWMKAAEHTKALHRKLTPKNAELERKMRTLRKEGRALQEAMLRQGDSLSRPRFLDAYQKAQVCLARFAALDTEIEITRRMTSPTGAIDLVGQKGPNMVLGNSCRLASGVVVRVSYVGYAQVSWRDVPEDIHQFHPAGGKILAVRSTDGGKTWSAPITVVDDGNDNRAPMLAEEPNGTLVCHFVSLSTRPVYAALAFVRSYDSGLMWEKEPTRVTAEPYAFTASQVSGKQLDVEVGEPRLIMAGPVGETRWGHWQFPILSKLRDGRLLVVVQVEDDSMLSYGKPGKPFISSDNGKTWALADLRKEGLPEALGVAFNAVLSVPNGDLVAFTIQTNLAKKDLPLPMLIATIPESYGQVISYYRARDLPQELSVVKMVRLSRGSHKWVEEEAFLDIPNRLVGCNAKEGMIPRPMFQTGKFVSADDGSLLFVAPMKILEPDGRVPARAVNYCLRSTDNGHTWKLRGRVAYNPYAYQDDLAEPDLCATADGTLVCVLRTTDGKGLGPMLLTTSRDSGKTWSRLRLLENFGDVPRLLTLENGVTVLSYGRPGVRLLFSADGTGQCWEHPVAILPGPSLDKKVNWYSMEAESCGNNSNLVPLGPDRFLMAYSDFTYRDDTGNVRKAIFTREIQVRVKP